MFAVGVWIALAVSFTGTASSLLAQSTSTWFVGAGAGLGWHDRRGNGDTRAFGGTQQVHVGRRLGKHWAAVAELAHLYVGQNASVYAIPCPSGACEHRFAGPVQIMWLTVAGQVQWVGRETRITASLGPSAHFVHQGTGEGEGRGVRPGINLGADGALRLRTRLWAILSVRYHRLFSGESNPRWLVPITVGLEIR